MTCMIWKSIWRTIKVYLRLSLVVFVKSKVFGLLRLLARDESAVFLLG